MHRGGPKFLAPPAAATIECGPDPQWHIVRCGMALSISKVTLKSVCALVLLVAASATSMGQQSQGQDSIGAQIQKLGWKVGPSEGKIAGRATIAIPAKYRFLGAADTSKFLTLQGNLPSTDNYTFAPDDLNWF